MTVTEHPGSFQDLYSIIWPCNVTEFSYRYKCNYKAHICIYFQPLKNFENDFDDTLDGLRSNEFNSFDVSGNNLAKVHVRHLAGGRYDIPHERVFRFDFPEMRV